MRCARIALLFALAATAEGAETIALHGWLDGYYAWNSLHPSDHLNFFQGIGTTAERADQLALNVAAVDVVRDPKPFGFHLTLTAGDSSNVVHLAETRRFTKYVYQASATWSHGAFAA